MRIRKHVDSTFSAEPEGPILRGNILGRISAAVVANVGEGENVSHTSSSQRASIVQRRTRSSSPKDGTRAVAVTVNDDREEIA